MPRASTKGLTSISLPRCRETAKRSGSPVTILHARSSVFSTAKEEGQASRWRLTIPPTRVTSFSGEYGQRGQEKLCVLAIDRIELNFKDRPKVNGLPVPARVRVRRNADYAASGSRLAADDPDRSLSMRRGLKAAGVQPVFGGRWGRFLL